MKTTERDEKVYFLNIPTLTWSSVRPILNDIMLHRAFSMTTELPNHKIAIFGGIRTINEYEILIY